VEKIPFALSLSKGSSSFLDAAAGKRRASTGSARTVLMSVLAVGLIAFAPALALAQTPPPQDSTAGMLPAGPPDYANPAYWLCLPGRADPCGKPLDTTALNANGYGSSGQVVPDRNAKADCFYVYPTVSRDPGLNSDLAEDVFETSTAVVQFARFASVCSTYAPLYRQVTVAALPRAFAGEDLTPNFAIAYGDVLAAWKNFLATRNKGRPFVLIGHSQGSIHLLKLLQEEIEGRPVAKKMLSAILLGWAVEVPEGKLVGGSLKSTPLCSKAGQTGCVITYMSFRASTPPPPGSFLGRAAKPGMTAGCTNPAALRGGQGKLDSYWFVLYQLPPSGEPVHWSNEGAPPTPFFRTEGLVDGECRHDGQAGYLAIAENADPRDGRADRIHGDVYIGGQLDPGWGLHLVDMNLAQGDLLRLIEAQAASKK
jgi:hypothetical protein